MSPIRCFIPSTALCIGVLAVAATFAMGCAVDGARPAPPSDTQTGPTATVTPLSQFDCPRGKIVVHVNFAIDDAHRHVVMYSQPSFYVSTRHFEGDYDGQTDIYLEVRDDDDAVLRSINLWPRGFVIRDFQTDYDPHDTLNSQDVRVSLDRGASYLAFVRISGRERQALPVYLLKDGADVNVLHGGQDYEITDIATPLGTAVDRLGTCQDLNPQT